MIGFVLSGGGNRGAIEAGGLTALFESGIRPDLLVGSSAGALNSAFVASRPTLEGARQLAGIWQNTRREDLFPDNVLVQALRFLSGANSLSSNRGLSSYVSKHKPEGVEQFRDLAVKLYLTTANLATGTLYLYGDDPTASILEAVLASAALPGVFPPVLYHGQQFVDGGVVANVPISIAMDKGATVIYAMDLWNSSPRPLARGVINIVRRAIDVTVYQQLVSDLRRARQDPAVQVHHIYMGDLFDGVAMDDFSQIKAMVKAGHQRTLEYLDQPMPLSKGGQIGVRAAPAAPPGARRYLPPS